MHSLIILVIQIYLSGPSHSTTDCEDINLAPDLPGLPYPHAGSHSRSHDDLVPYISLNSGIVNHNNYCVQLLPTNGSSITYYL